MKSLFSLFLLLFVSLSVVTAQQVEEKPKETPKEEKVPEPLPVDRASNFSLIFQRGFMLVTEKTDTVTLNGGLSGSFTLATSFKVNLYKNVLGLRLQPGITWVKADYAQASANTFPSSPDSYEDNWIVSSEKHRFTFLEFPIGLYANLTKDEDGDAKVFIEGGGYFGYKLGAMYKLKYDEVTGNQTQTVTSKRTNVPDLEDFRYGIYGRFGYKWISVYYSYRLSDVFQPFRTDPETGLPTSFAYPRYSPMELGVSVFL